jgi:hypothetical protein
MTRKQALRNAEVALQHLQYAIEALKNPEGTPKGNPEYDLWRAWQELGSLTTPLTEEMILED